MVSSLYHITHLDNLPGIVKRGLLCRQRIDAAGIAYVDLSDPSCQARRSERQVGGIPVDLHNYVPLFFNPRNPMLWRLWRHQLEAGENDRLAILQISAQPTSWQASLLADGIASSGHSSVYRAVDPAGRAALDWEAIRQSDWRGAPWDKRRKLMAEVLVSGSLSPRHIRKIWLQQPSALQHLALRLPEATLACCDVDESHALFFDA